MSIPAYFLFIGLPANYFRGRNIRDSSLANDEQSEKKLRRFSAKLVMKGWRLDQSFLKWKLMMAPVACIAAYLILALWPSSVSVTTAELLKW